MLSNFLYCAEHSASKQIAGYADYSIFDPFRALNTLLNILSFFMQIYWARSGQSLMLKLIEHAQQNAIHVMVGAIDHENQASIALHEKLGLNKPVICRKLDRNLDNGAICINATQPELNQNILFLCKT